MIALNKTELANLCDTSNREQQIRQLDAWGIPFELTLRGNVKVLHRDLVWSAEKRAQGEPDYDAA